LDLLGQKDADFIFSKLENDFGYSQGTLTNKILLEVGCGFAYTLFYLHKKYKWPQHKITGIDKISSSKVNAETIKDIRSGELTKLPFNDNYFDVILFIRSIEHIPNIGETLEKVRKIIKDDGVVFFLEIPDNGSIRRIHDGARNSSFIWFDHFWHLKVETMTMLLNKYGFNVYKIFHEDHGRDMSFIATPSS